MCRSSFAEVFGGEYPVYQDRDHAKEREKSEESDREVSESDFQKRWKRIRSTPTDPARAEGS